MNFVIPLNLPKAPLKIIKKKDEYYVFCIIRKKSLLITPEEWVRQHILHFLVNENNIPIERIASEATIKVNTMTRRCDIVVFDNFALPNLIVECKAPDVPLNDAVIHQVSAYNKTLQVDYLMLSNGIEHLYYKIDKENGELNEIERLPQF